VQPPRPFRLRQTGGAPLRHRRTDPTHDLHRDRAGAEAAGRGVARRRVEPAGDPDHPRSGERDRRLGPHPRRLRLSEAANHAGAAAVYAAMPVAHDMIGLYFAVGNANHLPPWGGVDMLLSTNPIAVAVPALAEPPLILDMATTVAAYGKVKVAAQQGKTMPEGWMIDRQGQPLTDPN